MRFYAGTAWCDWVSYEAYMSDIQPQSAEQIPEPIRQFLESLIKQAGVEADAPNLRYTKIEELYKALNNYLLSVAIEKLPKSDLEDFTKFAQGKPTSEQMSAYLSERIEGADAVFTDAMEQFETLYLASARRSIQSAEPDDVVNDADSSQS